MVLSTSSLEEKHLRLMTALNLEDTIWKEIDPSLLLLAFTHRSGVDQIPLEIQQYQEENYLANDYEWHEFIGDAVLEMIITTIMTELQEIQFLRNAHRFRQEIVRNLTLYCYMVRRGLCREIIIDPSFNYDYKICADSLEALIGVLYWWGYYHQGMGYAVFNQIRSWLVQSWYLQETIINLLDGKGTGCGVNDKGYGEWTEWTQCQAGVPGEQQRVAPCLDPRNCTGDLVEKKKCPIQLRPTAPSFIPTTTPTIPTNPLPETGFMSMLRFQQLGEAAQVNRLNYEINQLLRQPQIRGNPRTRLINLKREAAASGNYQVAKRKLDALAVRNGYSILSL